MFELYWHLGRHQLKLGTHLNLFNYHHKYFNGSRLKSRFQIHTNTALNLQRRKWMQILAFSSPKIHQVHNCRVTCILITLNCTVVDTACKLFWGHTGMVRSAFGLSNLLLLLKFLQRRNWMQQPKIHQAQDCHIYSYQCKLQTPHTQLFWGHTGMMRSAFWPF